MTTFRLSPNLCAVWAFLTIWAFTTVAEIPLTINHQGVVKVNGLPFTGNGEFKFGFYAGGTNLWLWTNDGTQLGTSITNRPTDAVTIPVANGIYNVRLGDTGLIFMVPIPSSMFDGDDVKLRVFFNDGSTGEQLLIPDQPVSSGAYAFHALKSDDADTLDGLHASDLSGPTGYFYGGVISNSTGDIANDLTISSLTCRDDNDRITIRVPTLTKSADAPWAAGDNQGGLDTGVKGVSLNIVYYVWAIGDSVGINPGDFIFSTSGTNPNLPGGYDVKRLIGGRLWFGSTWQQFQTIGNGPDKWVYLKNGLNLLANGSARDGQYENVDVSNKIPMLTTRLIEISAIVRSSSVTETKLFVRSTDSTATGDPAIFTGSAGAVSAGRGHVLLDANGMYQYVGPSTISRDTDHTLWAYWENL